ncbi:MAG TPA: mannose-1-phosphate guanylyltransferase/mannose-6-phosphate isomerase [Gammaproteobacteria bacterium]|nr:mannose-1-phosphate guanylyltransferase/mannose-6-phosphate isomerase [Gammaproteobacteria bacterium]
MHYYPVILTGGAGSRLWPISREFYPKPLLPIFGEHTLLQDTARRLDAIEQVGNPVFVCNEEHRFLVAEQVRELGKTPEAIMLEPEGRNTAPALTIAALYLADKEADALMVVMPADHVITDQALFTEAVKRAGELAADGYLVTFGIRPLKPETGYGYIRRGAEIEGSGSFRVDRFVEKPDAATAQSYVDAGDYYWNSGIFVLRADRWLEEIGRYQPAMLAACRKAFEGGSRDSDFVRVERDAFLASPSDSIDYAVMEKTDRAAVVPLAADWSDVGSWLSIWEVSEQDDEGNVVRGDVLLHDSRDSLFMADERCIAAVGVRDIVVVETADAVLVADRHRSQDVKAIVSRLKEKNRDEYRFHRRVYRPWGDYEGIDQGTRYQVKRLTVKPGAKLSLQMHHHRAEHWIVVSGTAKVTRGDETFMLSENESTYIPIGTNHRLENPGTIPLEIIEVQSGSYLGEDDIVRFEDDYDRIG